MKIMQKGQFRLQPKCAFFPDASSKREFFRRADPAIDSRHRRRFCHLPLSARYARTFARKNIVCPRASFTNQSSLYASVFQIRTRWTTWTVREWLIPARTAVRSTTTTPVWRGIWNTSVAWNQNFTVLCAHTRRSTNRAWTPIWTAGTWSCWTPRTYTPRLTPSHLRWMPEINFYIKYQFSLSQKRCILRIIQNLRYLTQRNENICFLCVFLVKYVFVWDIYKLHSIPKI